MTEVGVDSVAAPDVARQERSGERDQAERETADLSDFVAVSHGFRGRLRAPSRAARAAVSVVEALLAHGADYCQPSKRTKVAAFYNANPYK